jgi:hypothetical protein
MPEVFDLARAEPARAYFGRDRKAGRVLGWGGLFRNPEFSPDQPSAAWVEAEDVREVPQPVSARSCLLAVSLGLAGIGRYV